MWPFTKHPRVVATAERKNGPFEIQAMVRSALLQHEYVDDANEFFLRACRLGDDEQAMIHLAKKYVTLRLTD